jgi:hypothetical protein
MDSEIEWEDPRPTNWSGKSESPKWQEMRDHPGKWMVWSRSAKSASLKSWKDKGFEATARSNDDSSYTIYTRFPES